MPKSHRELYDEYAEAEINAVSIWQSSGGNREIDISSMLDSELSLYTDLRSSRLTAKRATALIESMAQEILRLRALASGK